MRRLAVALTIVAMSASIGCTPDSGRTVDELFADYDAERKFVVPNLKIADPKSCQCGEVLKGVIKPHECKVSSSLCWRLFYANSPGGLRTAHHSQV